MENGHIFWLAPGKKKASVHWKACGTGAENAMPASPPPTRSCMIQIQRRRVPSRSTTGDQNGFTTQGR